jgi:hypothetical protein
MAAGCTRLLDRCAPDAEGRAIAGRTWRDFYSTGPGIHRTQLLYGNVGYRIIEANVRELLHNPLHGEASWC